MLRVTRDFQKRIQRSSDGAVQTVPRTEKMNVIGHDHVAADQPCRCRTPGCDNCFVSRSGCQNLTSLGGASRDENDDRPVVRLTRHEMNRMPPLRRDVLLHVLRFRLGTCRSMSLRGMSLRSIRWRTHAGRCAPIAIRFVISTASSSAAIAWNPETRGSRPVLAHSTNDVS